MGVQELYNEIANREIENILCPVCNVRLTGASVAQGVIDGKPNAMCDDCLNDKFKRGEVK